MLKRKSQASLEMVVGLIILLVVAAVIIGLVLYFINPKRIPEPGATLDIRAFLQECEQHCKDFNSIEFCRSYYDGDDWNENGLKAELIQTGKYRWPACEDRIYCFLVSPCEERFGVGVNPMENCQRILCQSYAEKGLTLTQATESLWRDVGFSNKCQFINVAIEENWYARTFALGCV